MTSSAYPYPLPSGWTWCSLDDVATSMTDGPFGSNLKSSDYIPSGVRVIRLGNIGVGAFKDDDRSFISEEKFASLTKHEARAGDLVIAALADPVGRACIVPDTVGQALVKADCVRARITPEVGAMLVMRWMNSPEGLRSAALASHGIGRLRINLGEMRALPVPLPPAPEQRRIVAKLDEVFAQTRAAKARLERLPALIDKLKRSILAAAFRGDLTADWRAANPDVEPARELLERVFAARQTDGRRRGATRDDGTASAALPTGWAWTTIGDICDVGTGATPQRGEPRFWMDGHIPWVTSGAANSEFVDAAKEFVTDAALAETNLTLYPAGTLLIAMYGEGQTRGRCAELRVSATTNQALAALRTDQLPSSLKALLKFFLWDRYEALRMHAAGGVQPNLNLSIIRGITVPVPPLAEQAVIIDLLRGALQSVAAITARDLEMGARVGAIERAALAKAFRGELVPQDPADEPAEVLLARLRAAKAEEAPVARRSRAAAPEPTYAAPPITLAQAAESGPLFQHALERRERAAPEPAAQDLVVAALQQSDGRLTAAAIAQTTGLAPAAVRAALKDLIAAGQVHTHGKARGTTYTWAG